MEQTHFESLYPNSSWFEEIKKILFIIKEGGSCEIVGLPGVGRSNILRLLTYNRDVRINHLGENQRWFHFVLCNFSEVKKRPLLDVTKFLFLNLVDSLRERAMEEEHIIAEDMFREALSFNDELVLFQGLKKAIDFLALEKQQTIIFLFDRFEDYIPMLTSDFFTNLRIIRNRAKYRFSVIFSMTRPLEDVVDPTILVDFYEFISGHTIYLPLTDKPGVAFRTSYLEKVAEKKIAKKMLEEICMLTGGHGKLTRLCEESILTHEPNKQNASSLSDFFLQQKTIQGALFEIWNSLSPSEQTSLISKAGDDDFLQKIRAIENGKITIPLFEKFIEKQVIQIHDQMTHLSFDPTTNTIKKGEVILSDFLTTSEFRLLRFLLENPDRIIEREEIVKIVWKDTTTIGVSEQALDQLIFRLRKKIEDEPTNPTRLQTIKGRGLRLVQ